MNIYFRTQTPQNYAEFSYIANARMGHPEEMHKRSTCDVSESLRRLRERKESVCVKEKNLFGFDKVFMVNSEKNYKELERHSFKPSSISSIVGS